MTFDEPHQPEPAVAVRARPPATATARNLRVLDPGCIVWDEIVAF